MPSLLRVGPTVSPARILARQLQFALALFAFGTVWTTLAGTMVYGAWRLPTFDAAHAVTVGREPLDDGTVADTDVLLARLPIWARLTLYLVAAGLSAWWLTLMIP